MRYRFDTPQENASVIISTSVVENDDDDDDDNDNNKEGDTDKTQDQKVLDPS